MDKTTIQEAIEVLESVEASSSRTVKEQTLAQHAENPALQVIIQLAYGSQRYNVYPDRTCETMKKRVLSSGGVEKRFHRLQEVCGDLSARKATGKEGFLLLRRFLNSCPRLEHKWFTRVFDRDLGIGVGKLTIPKIWPDLLRGDAPYNKCMLAEEWEKKTKGKRTKGTTVLEEPFLLWSEPKLDGLRVTTLIDERGNVTMWTRGGKPVEHLPHIERALQELGAKGIVLDGEMVCFDRSTGQTDWRKTLSLAKPRKKVSEEMAKDIEESVEYRLFDAVPLRQYSLGACSLPLRKRRAKLKLVLALEGKEGPLGLVKRTVVRTMEDIRQCYESYLEQGYEGAIIKDPEAPYVCKRSRSWLKIKPTRDRSGLITGFKRGRKGHDQVEESVVADLLTIMAKWGKVVATKTGYEVPSPGVVVFDRFWSKLPLYLRQRIVHSSSQTVSFRTAARLGSLQVVPKGEKNWIHVGGFTQDLREEIWDHKKRYHGQWIDYKEQQDPGDTGATRFCRFIRFRAAADVDDR